MRFGSPSAWRRSATFWSRALGPAVLTARQLVSGRTRSVFEPLFHQFRQALEIFAHIGIVADLAQLVEDGLVALPGGDDERTQGPFHQGEVNHTVYHQHAQRFHFLRELDETNLVFG